MPRRTITIVTCSLCESGSDDESQYLSATLTLGPAVYEYDLCKACTETDARVTGLVDHGIKVRGSKAKAAAQAAVGKEPCPECARLVTPGTGMSRHRQAVHGVQSATSARKAAKAAAPKARKR